MYPLTSGPGRFIKVRFGGLSTIFLQLKDPLEQFVKRGEFFSVSGFLFRRNMT